MKVLHLTTPGHACGVKQYTLSMIDAFPKEEGDEHAILSDAQEALRRLASGTFDLFHLQWAAGSHSAADLLQINAFCHARHLPFLVTVHNHPVAVLPFQPEQIFVHQTREVAVLIEYGYDARKITKIDQGIPVLPLSAPPEENVFAMFGFMLPHKGILEAISALSLLRSRRPDLDARFLLSCAIHPPNERVSLAHRSDVEAHVALLGLSGCVECHTEFAAPESLPDRLQRAKVFLFPYLHGASQSSSAAVSMAAAMGRPAIVSDLPIFDNLREEGSIVFSPSGAIETLSERMEQVLQPGLYRALQSSAMEFRERRSWQKVAGEIHAVYESFMGAPPLRVYVSETGKKRIHLTAGTGTPPFSFSLVLAKIGKALERQGHEITASQIHPYIQNEVQFPFPTGMSDIHIRFCYPPQFDFHAGAKRVLFFCWETTRIPETWVSPLSQVDHLITFSQFSHAALERSGVEMSRVSVIPLGVEHAIYRSEGEREDWRDCAGGFDQEPFVFFHGGALDARKGTADLIRTYMRTFTREDNTLLVVKSNSAGNTYDLPALIAEESRQSSCPARVHLLQREIPDEAMAKMMRSASVGVFPYRAEGGAGLVIMETMACGTPVMISHFGAPRQYVHAANGFLIGGEETASMFLSGQHVEAPNATWYTPDVNHLGAMMRNLYEHPETVQARKEAAKRAVESFTWERSAKELMQALS